MSPFNSFIKKNLLILSLVFLVYGWFFATHITPQQTPLKVLEADTNISIFQEPEAGRDPILKAIKNASSEILVEVYLLSDKQVIKSLQDAKNRGVTVDVMLEQHPFGGGNLNNVSKKALTDAGISVEWTNSIFSLTHEKAIVIDKNQAFILNQNLTTSSFVKNREYDVYDINPEDVAGIRNIFISDWERKTFTPTKTHLIVSPNNSRPALTTLIADSQKEIDIEIEDINDDKIVSLLSDKAKNIKIRLIVPTFSQINSNEKSVRQLINAGVLVKTLSSPYVHAKLILIDELRAYVGSVNLSSQSMDENRELGIILSHNDSLRALDSTFESDWNRAKTVN